MILSRVFAKRRIASGVRPGWGAAWGLVLMDGLLLAALIALLFQPLMTLIYVIQPPTWVTVLILFVVIFIPIQVVLIVSSLWAARSRFVEEEVSDG